FLHVVVALAEDALGGLANGGVGLGEQVVQALTVCVALLVLIGEGPQLGVGEAFEVLFDGVDLVRDAVQLAQDLAFACTHDLRKDRHGGWSPCRSGLGRSVSISLTEQRPSYARTSPRREPCRAVTVGCFLPVSRLPHKDNVPRPAMVPRRTGELRAG